MDLVELAKSKNSQRHPWEIARLNVTLKLLKNYGLNQGKPITILDLGCGDTYVAEQLHLNFPSAKIFAVDIAFTEEILTNLKEKYRDKPIFVCNNLEEISQSIKFDFVLLMDVVEHISNDQTFLTALKSSSNFTSDTVFYITVPAFNSLFCSHDTFLGHYRRYTNAGLTDLIKRSGFIQYKIGYFFSILILPRLIQVIKEKIFPPKDETTGLVEWQGSKSKTNLIAKILILDFQIFNSTIVKFLNVPGLSNFIICKIS